MRGECCAVGLASDFHSKPCKSSDRSYAGTPTHANGTDDLQGFFVEENEMHSLQTLNVSGVEIAVDGHGRFSLNDLHKASGSENRHRPTFFLRRPEIKELVAEIDKCAVEHIWSAAPIEVSRGTSGSTYVCKELVYAYAMWISPAFHLQVIRTFDAVSNPQTSAPAIPQTFAQALRLAAEQQELIEQQQALLAEQKPAVEFVDRYVSADTTKSIREVAKIVGIKERQFIARMELEDILYRQSEKLLPFAEYQDRGYFVVKTGEANSHAYYQTRFTTAGIAWIAKRFQPKGAA